MPELPDIEVFTRNLNKQFKGRKLIRLNVVNGKKLKDKPGVLKNSLEGRRLKKVFRSGKEMRFEFSGNVLMGVHLMLTGDLFSFEGKNDRKTTLIEMYFDKGKALALTDRMKNAFVYLNPIDKEGIDALDPKLTIKRFREILQRKTNVKNVLLDQNSIRGIGNGYSDEILWKARISPFSIAQAIPDDKAKELLKHIRSTLKSAINKIDKKYPGLIQGEVRDFMEIHSKKATHSPTGSPIRMADRGMLKTFYTDEQVEYK